ncbi:hypothetical protein RMSM_02454 [Rhodopirellula maiorica SM1]|uniref:Uncharacterized protein n=1 Tax=Rhodopirellula maiorica SM1 TaxID=1265738 RepID=M5RYZ4_9BACT|nr:hypothetical protein RMSM_02454 [Rhodopirellula maiorica SM1]
MEKPGYQKRERSNVGPSTGPLLSMTVTATLAVTASGTVDPSRRDIATIKTKPTFFPLDWL